MSPVVIVATCVWQASIQDANVVPCMPHSVPPAGPRAACEPS